MGLDPFSAALLGIGGGALLGDAFGGGGGSDPAVERQIAQEKKAAQDAAYQQWLAENAVNGTFGVPTDPTTLPDILGGPDLLRRRMYIPERSPSAVGGSSTTGLLGGETATPVGGEQLGTPPLEQPTPDALPDVPNASDPFTRLSESQLRAIEAAKSADPNFLTTRPDIARRLRYEDVRNALVQKQTGDLNLQRDTALRDLGFGLARAGLSGGSVDADRHADAQRQYGQALTDTSLRGDNLAGAMSAADEELRQSLLSRASSGASAADLRSSAASGITRNNALAVNAASENALGDLFAGLANVGQEQTKQAARGRAQQALANYGALFTPSSYSGSVS